MTDFLVKAYCAGINLFEKIIPQTELDEFMKATKESLERGEFTITFGTGQTQSVSEICIDVFETLPGAYRFELSRAFN